MAGKFWTKKEEEKLIEFCKSVSSFRELKKKVKKVKDEFPERSWDSIDRKIRREEWHEKYFIKKKITSKEKREVKDDLGFSPEEMKLKLTRLLQILKKGYTTITKISEDPEINIPKEDVWPLIDKLREKGYDIVEERRRVFLKEEPMPGLTPSLPPLTKKERIKVMFMSDLCFGLKTQQGDLVATCLEIGEKEEVFFNLIAGNLVAGKPSSRNKNEYFLETAQEQANYVVSHFPRASFNTYLLNGPREKSWARGKKGVKIEQYICKQRNDIRYLGDEKIVIPIGRKEAKAAVVTTSGTAYTKSYILQGVMENLQEAVYYVFEHSEPIHSVIAGGLYSGVLIPRQFPIDKGRYNDFDGVALPALHRITPSQTVQRKRGGSPVLGCLILGANFEKNGEFTGFTYTFYDLTAYYRGNDYLEKIEIDGALTNEAKKILSRLEKGPARAGELSRAIRRSIPYVKKILKEELENNGYHLRFIEARKAWKLERKFKKKFKPLDLKKLFKIKVRFLLTSDWHIGHKGERPDLIKQVFKIAKKEKVDLILHSGNIFEGTDAFRGQEHELLYHGADEQLKHLMEILPKSKIPMVMISSPLHEHDGVYWVRCGHDIVATFEKIAQLQGYRVRYLQESRSSQRGKKGKTARAVFEYKGIKFDLQHPRGGIPYGKTYRLQRRIEMLVSIMDLISGTKATFVGHLHRAVFMLYKGIAGFLVPCLKEEDEYITSLDKLPELGVWVVELAFDENKNLTKVELEYVPFEPRSEYMNFVDLDEDAWMKKWVAKKRRAS